MEAEFVEIVRKLVSERGKTELFNAKLCRSALADLTRNKYIKERNLILLAVESGAAKAIDGVNRSDLQICKQRQIRKLEEEYNCKQSAAEEVVNILTLILCEDCGDMQTIVNPIPADKSIEQVLEILSGIDERLRKLEERAASWEKTVSNIIIPGNYIEAKYGIEMVYVKGGTFTMGATPEQGGYWEENEKPSHKVTLSDFYIGKYPVTQAQWCKAMVNNPSHFKGNDLPVEMVSWDDVQEFIKKLNQNTGKNYRLPTEAEWEYAARGGSQSLGFKYSGSNYIGEVAWYGGNSGNKTHPAGAKNENELGIYDMCGNVWEWVNDWYESYNVSWNSNPEGAASGSSRVMRGGSWLFNAGGSRISSRSASFPGTHAYDLGFRIAISSK